MYLEMFTKKQRQKKKKSKSKKFKLIKNIYDFKIKKKTQNHK